MFDRIRPILALTGAALSLPAAGASYTIDSRHTFPSFEVSHIGFSTQRGRFDQTEGKIVLNPAERTGAIHISIAADSIDTGLTELENRLKEKDAFNSAQFPVIRYDAEKLVFEGDKPVRADGTLNFLGVSKPVVLEIGHFHCGEHPIYKRHVCGADATTRIKRSEFGMNAFLPAISDEVRILIQVEAFRD